jgi:hypothetical protein
LGPKFDPTLSASTKSKQTLFEQTKRREICTQMGKQKSTNIGAGFVRNREFEAFLEDYKFEAFLKGCEFEAFLEDCEFGAFLKDCEFERLKCVKLKRFWKTANSKD